MTVSIIKNAAQDTVPSVRVRDWGGIFMAVLATVAGLAPQLPFIQTMLTALSVPVGIVEWLMGAVAFVAMFYAAITKSTYPNFTPQKTEE